MFEGRFEMPGKPNSACKHSRTQLIARDADAHYVECLECGEILEGEELKTGQSKEASGFDESLSDA